MLFAINISEYLVNLNELVSLQDQVKAVRLLDKFGKQNFYEDMEKVFEPMTDAIKNTSENVTKIIWETYNHNNKAIENLNEKIFRIDE